MREILIILTISVVFSMLSCSVETKKSSGNDGDILLDDSDTAETDELVSADGDVAETDESVSADSDNAEPDEVTSSDGDVVETDDDLGVPDDFVDEDDVDLSDEDIDLLPPDTNHTTVQWGTDKGDIALSLALDQTGNIYMVGNTEGNLDGEINSGMADIFLTKFDSYGNKLWTKLYGTEKTDYGRFVKVDSSGNIYITGYTEGDFDGNGNKGGLDVVLMKLDKDGETQWIRQIGTEGADIGSSIVFDNSENIYIFGYMEGSFDGSLYTGNTDAFAAKFSDAGTLIWFKEWGSDEYDSAATAVFHSGYIYVPGFSGGDIGGTGFLGGYWDAFLTKMDADGNISWTKQWGTAGSDAAYSLQLDSASDIFICGSVGMEAELDYSVSVTKFSDDGDLDWIESWGSGYMTGGNNMISDEFGNFYISGIAGDDFDGYKNAGSLDVFLIKLDSSGKKMWTKLFGGEGAEMSSSSLIDKYGNIYVAGSTESDLDGHTNSGGYDIFLTKFNAEDL
ncbi:MAG TPA: SBBP repeat-containing protein [bacterium]|nr:SBBP repeat-containing protein [bacterium]HPS30997.1 SBBP repeat-containing protein [bacterium]